MIHNGRKIPLFNEIVTKERLKGRISYILVGGKTPVISSLKRL